jgi:hypothetical protein
MSSLAGIMAGFPVKTAINSDAPCCIRALLSIREIATGESLSVRRQDDRGRIGVVTRMDAEQVLILDAQTFCNDLADSAESWWAQASLNSTVQSNYARFVRRRPDGYTPHIVTRYLLKGLAVNGSWDGQAVAVQQRSTATAPAALDRSRPQNATS